MGGAGAVTGIVTGTQRGRDILVRVEGRRFQLKPRKSLIHLPGLTRGRFLPIVR
jgi:hypothetical protein